MRGAGATYRTASRRCKAQIQVTDYASHTISKPLSVTCLVGGRAPAAGVPQGEGQAGRPSGEGVALEGGGEGCGGTSVGSPAGQVPLHEAVQGGHQGGLARPRRPQQEDVGRLDGAGQLVLEDGVELGLDILDLKQHVCHMVTQVVE
jgi:hypothetical protein